VAAAPAFAEQTGIVVLGLWEPDADVPILVGLRYRPGQTPVLTREWTSDAVGGGPGNASSRNASAVTTSTSAAGPRASSTVRSRSRGAPARSATVRTSCLR